MALLSNPTLTAPGLQLAATGFSPSIALPMKTQIYTGEAGYSLLVNFSNGAVATATVQVSNDPNSNPNNPIAVQNTARWNSHDILQNLSASTNSSIVFPVYAVRLSVSAWTSGTISLDIGALDYLL
jgi:hypothetical protein